MLARTTRLVGGLVPLFVASVLLGSSPLQAQSSPLYNTAVENTPGLLGFYTYTQAAQANSVVNGYTGVLLNGATVGPVSGVPNNSALILNNGATGTKSAIAGGSNPLKGQIGNSGSILAWINLASLPSTQNRYFSIAGESQFSNDFDFQIETDNRIKFYTNGLFSSTAALTGSNLNNWIFLAATYGSGTDRSIYINGALAASSTPGPHTLNTSSPFYQGQSDVFGGRNFDGNLADVALYNTDLTGPQVAAIYAAASGTPTTTPEPSSIALLGTGLIGLVPVVRRKVRK